MSVTPVKQLNKQIGKENNWEFGGSQALSPIERVPVNAAAFPERLETSKTPF